MIKEALFEFAAEKGWGRILEVAHKIHLLSGIAVVLKKKESTLQIELRAMQTLGLLNFHRKMEGGGYRYTPTVLGMKFLQEQNAKIGRTFSCQLCGITTGMPHVCPCFYPEFK